MKEEEALVDKISGNIAKSYLVKKQQIEGI